MKGRKLTLFDLYELENETPIYMESNNNNKGKCYLLINMYDSMRICYSNNWDDYAYTEQYFINADAYEWIEEETPLHKMATEIVNLRGLDLTDDNIRLIVEEFLDN